MRRLSDDIHLLGDLLGEVLRAQGGEALLAQVETMRLAAKLARESSVDAEAQQARQVLAASAAALPAKLALDVARAFQLYFRLVNVAEDVQRSRTLRQRRQQNEEVAESLTAALATLRERGVSSSEQLAALQQLRLSFVLTAHPTEARRRTTERLLARVRELLEVLDRMALGATEQHSLQRRLRAAIEALWQHADERRAKPQVLDEVKAGLWYVRNVLLDAVPRLQRRLASAWVASGGEAAAELPVCVRFGSWMGGDRDGNPHVEAAVTERTLEMHRWIALDRYAGDLHALIDPLSASVERLPASEALQAAWQRNAAALPELLAETERRNADEPIRRLLSLMRERVLRSRDFARGGYARPQEMLQDLQAIQQVLLAAGAVALVEDQLGDLVQRLRCFGFHLLELDLREDSRVHRRVLAILLANAEYPQRSSAERRAMLLRLPMPNHPMQLDDEARRTLACFAGIVRWQQRFGVEAVHTYIVSMTESAVDVLEAMHLARLHDAVVLDFVPLFESAAALQSAAAIVDDLLHDDEYRQHLRRRGDLQEVLVGYSDSMKDSGILAARIGIQQAQIELAAVCVAHGVKLRIFHGRGGSLSRGGGPVHKALRALPPQTFHGDLKITEQGEMRATNFPNSDLALRYLEQSLSGALLASHQAQPPPAHGLSSAPSDAFAATWSMLRERSAFAYRQLLARPQLAAYFHATTPIATIAELHIASRPARRQADATDLSGLRAIPWVFAWSQARLLTPGWYGVGAALAAVAQQPEGAAQLRRLYAESLFFRDLLDNIQMTLAKADMPIAARYAELSPDLAAGQAIFAHLQQAYHETCEHILAITGRSQLLDDDEVLRRSIRLRNPYVDPLSYLQIEALRRLRLPSDADTAGAWRRIAHATVQGIAAGLRNTG